MNKIAQIFIFIGVTLFIGGVSDNARSSAAKIQEEHHVVRVAVLQGVDQLALSVRGAYQFYDPEKRIILGEGRRMRKTRLKSTDQGIKIGLNELYVKRLGITSEKDVTLYVGGTKRRYRGQLDILRQEDGTLLVVNVVGLEQYIKGVLYHEVSHRWPMELLKAQAVAARTYARYRIKTNADEPYDVTSDIYSQVYGGRSAERYRTNLAVERTEGLILIYDHDVLPAYYHATCAGRTEDAAELWEEDLPPLKGVECPYCKISPHYRWKKNYQSKGIQDRLNAGGYKLGLIKDIRIIERNASGRVKRLAIATRDGKITTMDGKKFRSIVGPNFIKSNSYTIEMEGYYFNLHGQGWGHGVGMCQWGAYGMSRKRFPFDEILTFYYPGAELADGREMEFEPDIDADKKTK